MEFENPSLDTIHDLLSNARTIAVVGLSPKEDRPSHGVARAMQGFGFKIIPVRPAVDSILGETAYASLTDLPETPDIVDVFRASEHVDKIVDQCIELGAKALWLQEGVINEAAAKRAQEAGMVVVMDKCIYKQWIALFGSSA
ncbi:MAG TPA: CoA-binding protein [Gammaproteobacteria bacterium]|nr:CoA-binding protein [Gammaproteobacteria bacterium]